MCRRQEGYQVTKAYTFDDIWALGPCWNEGRVREAIDAVGGSVTATQIAESDIDTADKLWVLTRLLARRDLPALIAWVWRCLARVLRDCPHPQWRAMLAAPGDVTLARAASDAAGGHAATAALCASHAAGYYAAVYDAADADYYAVHVADAAYYVAIYASDSAATTTTNIADLAVTMEAL